MMGVESPIRFFIWVLEVILGAGIHLVVLILTEGVNLKDYRLIRNIFKVKNIF